MPVQPTLDGTTPAVAPDYPTWVDLIEPTFETVAQTDPSEMVREHAHWAIRRLTAG